MVSKHATFMIADEASPEPSRTNMRLVFQQHHLVMNICGTIYQLLRPFFVTALRESPQDPASSTHAQAFLAVVERSRVQVTILMLIIDAGGYA
jgi:hypothetical protein